MHWKSIVLSNSKKIMQKTAAIWPDGGKNHLARHNFLLGKSAKFMSTQNSADTDRKPKNMINYSAKCKKYGWPKQMSRMEQGRRRRRRRKRSCELLYLSCICLDCELRARLMWVIHLCHWQPLAWSRWLASRLAD